MGLKCWSDFEKFNLRRSRMLINNYFEMVSKTKLQLYLGNINQNVNGNWNWKFNMERALEIEWKLLTP